MNNFRSDGHPFVHWFLFFAPSTSSSGTYYKRRGVYQLLTSPVRSIDYTIHEVGPSIDCWYLSPQSPGWGPVKIIIEHGRRTLFKRLPFACYRNGGRQPGNNVNMAEVALNRLWYLHFLLNYNQDTWSWTFRLRQGISCGSNACL